MFLYLPFNLPNFTKYLIHFSSSFYPIYVTTRSYTSSPLFFPSAVHSKFYSGLPPFIAQLLSTGWVCVVGVVLVYIVPWMTIAVSSWVHQVVGKIEKQTTYTSRILGVQFIYISHLYCISKVPYTASFSSIPSFTNHYTTFFKSLLLLKTELLLYSYSSFLCIKKKPSARSSSPNCQASLLHLLLHHRRHIYIFFLNYLLHLPSTIKPHLFFPPSFRIKLTSLSLGI